MRRSGANSGKTYPPGLFIEERADDCGCRPGWRKVKTAKTSNKPFETDDELYLASYEAYQNWVLDFCSVAPDRLYPVGYVPMRDIDETCEVEGSGV